MAALVLSSISPLCANPTDPKAILEASLEKVDNSHSQFTQEEEIINGQDFRFTRYAERSPDGILLERIETELHDKGAVVHELDVHNTTGDWMIFPWGAVQLNFPSDILRKFETPTITNQDAYKMSEMQFGSPPKLCYKITVTADDAEYNRTLDAIQKLLQLRSSQLSDVDQIGIPKAEERVPYQYDYYIDKDSGIIWGENIFSRSGVLLRSHLFTSVEFDKELSQNLFTIPTNLKKTVVNSPLEYFNITTKNHN
jgi:hypothetical protein